MPQSALRHVPLDGSVTVLPGFVDFHARYNPDHPWVAFPSRKSPSQVCTVSFGEFSKATHRVAHKLRPNRSGFDGEVVALLIHTDSLLYLALLAGFARAGVVPLPISPRNSPEAVANLLEKTGCHRIMSQASLRHVVAATQKQLARQNHEVKYEELYSLHELYPTLESAKESQLTEGPFPESNTEPHPEEVVMILHSSGSTGLPKPVPQTRKIQLQWAHAHQILEGRKRGLRMGAMALPSFHTMGIYTQLLQPLVSGYPVSLYTPQYPDPPVVPSPQNVIEVAKLTKVNGIPSVPSLVEVWAQSDDIVEYLASLDYLSFAGGPLSVKSGAKLVKAGVNLYSVYGSTEAGATTLSFNIDDSEGPDAPWKTSADWEWLAFKDDVNLRWIPQGDGSYELHYLTCEHHQPAIENLPDVKGYATSDLFEPHPKKEGLWRIVGRADDVIVLSSGEKIVPIPQEGHLVSSPLVAGAVMFGRGHLQPGILLEPTAGNEVNSAVEHEVVAFRNKVWPVVEEANASAPTFGRIFKEMILFTDPKKPLPRAAKGTVVRKQALALYEEEINNLYQSVEDSTDAQGIAPPQTWSPKDIEAWLAKHATSLNNDNPILSSTDIFDQGFDSLSATFLRNRIIGALRSSAENQTAASQIGQNFVFDHPTINRLAAAIHQLITSEPQAQAPDRARHIVDLVEKYTKDLPKRDKRLVHTRGSAAVVLLTGSTGNLGSHILATLLASPHISKVYTLDRASRNAVPRERQKAVFEDRGLPVDLLTCKKLTTLVGDLGNERFGLDEVTFGQIKDSVTHIVHNAWKVNFNHTLSSFEPLIASTRKLVDLCFSVDRAVSLLFISSISVASGWDKAKGPVPEEPLADPTVDVHNGYGASKFVVEKLLGKASENGLDAISLRVGQVCGSATTGAWNVTDWVPILVKSSINMNALPSLSGTVDWIQMDSVAQITADLILSHDPTSRVLNVVHPRPVPWDAVLGAINRALGAKIPIVPYQAWLAELEALNSNPSPEIFEKVPALKLLEFFRGLAPVTKEHQTDLAGNVAAFATSSIQKQSPTIKDLQSITDNHAHAWVQYWKNKGVFA